MTIKTSNIPGEFILLTEDELDKLNTAHLAGMAGSAAKDAIIDELQKELAEARAELARLKPDWKVAPEWAHSISFDIVWLGDGDDILRWKTETFDHHIERRPKPTPATEEVK